MIEVYKKNAADAAAFYDQNYDGLCAWIVQPTGEKFVLGPKENRVCRFCGLDESKTTFKLEAHAIPEAFGNKSISTNYECDPCNQLFGGGIETDLGGWSKPMRTFARIRGKNGVPTIKKGGPGPGWRIEYGETGFKMSQYEDDPFFEVDEEKRQLRFSLTRDSYTPVAVLKAFVKIGLSLMPEEEISNFSEALAWIREKDHTKKFFEGASVIRTFRPGPMPNDVLSVMILRRKAGVSGIPYSFLVLGFGNDLFQVVLPSPRNDASVKGKDITLPPFPMIAGPDLEKYGLGRRGVLNLSGRDVVRGEKLPIVLGFESATLIPGKPVPGKTD